MFWQLSAQFSRGYRTFFKIYLCWPRYHVAVCTLKYVVCRKYINNTWTVLVRISCPNLAQIHKIPWKLLTFVVKSRYRYSSLWISFFDYDRYELTRFSFWLSSQEVNASYSRIEWTLRDFTQGTRAAKIIRLDQQLFNLVLFNLRSCDNNTRLRKNESLNAQKALRHHFATKWTLYLMQSVSQNEEMLTTQQEQKNGRGNEWYYPSSLTNNH